MNLVETYSETANERIPINIYADSTDATTMLPYRFSIHPTRNEEIPQLSGTDRFLHIFGIPVIIEVDEDAIIVTDYIIHMYGVGNTVQEAIEDYKISIEAYLEELQEDKDRLGNNLKQHLYYLQNKSKYFE